MCADSLIPETDPSIDRLGDEARRAIAKHWAHRSRSEHDVSVAFELLRPRLEGVGAEDVVLALADKAIDDERRHSDLCLLLARRYAGSDVVAEPARPVTLPVFGAGDEPLEVALIVLGMCCVNESLASEWIRSCWQAATSPTAIAANRAHLKDEIDHARLGWAHFASSAVSPAMKRALVSAAWPSKILEANVAEWRRPDEHLPAEGIPDHGHLSVRDHLAAIDAGVRDVVLPGFAHVGLVEQARP